MQVHFTDLITGHGVITVDGTILIPMADGTITVIMGIEDGTIHSTDHTMVHITDHTGADIAMVTTMDCIMGMHTDLTKVMLDTDTELHVPHIHPV